MSAAHQHNASHRPVIIVAGPTASGKSALAMDVAAEFDGVVINADSMQVYRDLRVITARPSPQDEARVSHRLFGVLDGAEICSAGRWLDMVVKEINAAHDAGKLPIVVGGTGLYLKALSEGLSPIPDIPESARASAETLLADIGQDALRARLSEGDPESAARIAQGDRQRLVRAWEVLTHTGTSLSDWQKAPTQPPLPGARFGWLVLTPPRESLYAAIDARFERMVAEGGLDEVSHLVARGLDPALPVMKALGVPELAAYLAGEMDRDGAVAKAQQTSRNYAKRQLTWLRGQVSGEKVISAQYSESLKAEIFSFIRHFLLTEQV